MTELRLYDLPIRGAAVGPPNPLPPMEAAADVHDIEMDERVPAEMKTNIRYGMKASPLPYAMQDGYTREKAPMVLKTAVLENAYLKAVFTLEYGGRLWSLYDKQRGRDLIYENPVFQPANLAIRNAWLSGGVEWNIGLRGHSPFTCSDLFAARVSGEDGTPVLRLYEYERIRQVPFQLDFHLPNDSRQLYVYVRIRNPHDREIPMYWWSNIAYPEHAKTRVVVPAEESFNYGYGGSGLSLRAIPEIEGVDITYSRNIGHSADFFFHILPEQRKWIAALDESGTGLFQTSTSRLIGRKLFVWGSGPGGATWQEFLSEPGKPYIEIQAGLARTQLEHVPMPAGAEWQWLEAYGCAEADPEVVHGRDWGAARSALDACIENIVPEAAMDEYCKSAQQTADKAVDEILHNGSGWGRLESEFRRRNNLKAMAGVELPYNTDYAPGPRQWQQLLAEGTFPCPDPAREPVGYEVDPKWTALLERYTEKNPDNWYAWLHLGLMRYENGKSGEAVDAWTRSVELEANGWAYRNLARLAMMRGDTAETVALYEKAFAYLKTCFPLVVEFGKELVAAEKWERCLEVYEDLPAAMQKNGRAQLLYAQALLGLGRLSEAKAVIAAGPEVTDLREGENSLTDIWYRIHERIFTKEGGKLPEGVNLRDWIVQQYPPPANIDFRMHTVERIDQ